MENGVLIGFGLIVALILLIGIGIALVNIKDINRNQRSGSTDERKLVQPPGIQSRRNSSDKRIEFGEIINEKEKYYVEIKTSSSQIGHCPLCRQPLSKNETITCKNCGNQYHLHCFKENNNTCQSCKWVQP